ncbi:uncharacterized protein Z518_01784 [Rhinocladiella mackenziei CBS 650.93]|uniref:CCHC-type domain-containing protein n=1 Tax=Rhinocladiella mackenziei CBS 650.93 TaxID=1442369 RepID=A0A0D2JMJ5_9EURO|nr:uncharacterized protein Z518_01784 [Rhinocladiella mackenziei CBS 650.93]KIX10700.1 hypothetical protein Z518_01784 [Rhinocladiella mackenziei CBS 650.93]
MDTDMTNADGSPFDPYGPTVPSRAPPGISPTHQVPSSSGFQATPSTSQQGQADPTTLETVVPLELFQNIGGAGVEKPPKYGGQRENDAARVWLIGMERWLWAKEILLRRNLTGPERIALTTSYLEKAAAAWWNLTYIHNVDHQGHQLRIQSWAEWKNTFLSQFGDVRTQDQRRDEFDSLRQTGTVQAFRQAIESRRLYLEPRPSDADCLLVFKRGLKTSIRNRIEILPDSIVPGTYTKYVEFADKSEREMLATSNRVPFFKPRYGKPATSTTNSPSHARNSAAPRRDHDGDVEMTLNGMRTRPKSNNAASGQKTPGKTPPSRQKCREENLCFDCGEPGHQRKDCPKANQSTRRGHRGKGKGRQA